MAARKAKVSAHERVAEIRAQLERLREQHRAVESQPAGEWPQAIDASIAELQRTPAGHSLFEASVLTDSSFRAGTHAHRLIPAEREPATRGEVLRFLAVVAPEGLRAQLTAEVEQLLARGGEPVSAEERSRQLRDLDKQIHDFEAEEERIISAAEESGDFIERRGDADPEIVLAAID